LVTVCELGLSDTVATISIKDKDGGGCHFPLPHRGAQFERRSFIEALEQGQSKPVKPKRPVIPWQTSGDFLWFARSTMP
jgi:hypothetical protein